MSSSKAILIGQINRTNVKDLLFNEYAIHICISNIVSTTNIACKYIHVSVVQLDASIKVHNFLCVLNFNQ